MQRCVLYNRLPVRDNVSPTCYYSSLCIATWRSKRIFFSFAYDKENIYLKKKKACFCDGTLLIFLIGLAKQLNPFTGKKKASNHLEIIA